MKLQENEILQNLIPNPQNWLVESVNPNTATLILLERCGSDQPGSMRLSPVTIRPLIGDNGLPWSKKLGNFTRSTKEFNIVPHHHEFQITEGISSTYRYHLSKIGDFTKSLCQKPTMRTSIPMAAWGIQSHLNERWCQECMEAAGIQSMKKTLLHLALWEPAARRKK